MSDAKRLIDQIIFTEKSFGARELPREDWGEIQSSLGLSSASNDIKDSSTDWDSLEAIAKKCQECALSEHRTHVVFGEGNKSADLLFIGEAPGYDEDQQGRPFVGKAGQLLTRIIQAMGLTRQDVFIANCLKCRPPKNRNPLPDEIASCNPILRKQIQLIQPRVICALGKFAAQTLLATDTPISRMRGKFHDYDGIQLMPTFHPAYLLRNPQDKALVWNDIKLIMHELNLPIPSPKK